jgi:hypothetical protein
MDKILDLEKIWNRQTKNYLLKNDITTTIKKTINSLNQLILNKKNSYFTHDQSE